MIPSFMQGLTPEQINHAIIQSSQQVVDMSVIDEIMMETVPVSRGEMTSIVPFGGSYGTTARSVTSQRYTEEYRDIYDDM